MPTKKQQRTIALNQFYSNPVAKVSLELFLSIATVLFFAIFAIRPTLLTMSDLVKEIEDKRDLDQQLTRKVAALSTVQAEYLQLENRLTVLDEALPNNPQLTQSLKIIEKLASENNIMIDSISMPEVPSDKIAEEINYKKIERKDLPLGISVKGDYPSIRQFIEGLRFARRSFVIDTVVFSTEEKRGSKSLQANITMSLPYFGENK